MQCGWLISRLIEDWLIFSIQSEANFWPTCIGYGNRCDPRGISADPSIDSSGKSHLTLCLDPLYILLWPLQVVGLKGMMTKAVYSATKCQNHGEEHIALEEITSAMIGKYRDLTQNLPQVILVFRDGIDDGKFAQVSEKWVNQRLNNDKMVKMF